MPIAYCKISVLHQMLERAHKHLLLVLAGDNSDKSASTVFGLLLLCFIYHIGLSIYMYSVK